MSRIIAQLKDDERSPEERKADFLNAFEDLANVTKAAKRSRVPRRTVYDWIDNDENFKSNYEKSAKIAVGVLEDEATRRAVDGVNKNLYYQGKKIGSTKEYSDTLMIFLLKGLAPEKYKDRVQQDHTGIPAPTHAPQINVYNTAPPLAESEDQIEE